ncbi:MAG: DsrE family protein [Gammaproteobacteria bacterium]|nr:DsrE family protein [Gammaproteobacteria bacterium]
MNIHESIRVVTFSTFVSLLIFCSSVFAADDYYNESVPPQPKAFYDINLTNPVTMRDFLWVIDSTYDLLIQKGTPPAKIQFVVSLRGLSVAFATNEFGMGTPDEQVGIEIRGYLNSLLDKGVRIEACIISCEWVGVDPADLLAGVIVIDNAFASSIWYQTKGYALIPIHQLP